MNIEWIGARRGGAEKYAGIVARALLAAGHDVHLFARGVDSGEVPVGTPIHPVHTTEPPGLGWSRTYRFAAASDRALSGHTFDLVVGFNKTWRQDVYVAVAGAHPAAVEHGLRRFRNPLRRAAHRLGKWLSPKQWLFSAIERRQFGRGAPPLHVVAPSDFSARHFREHHGVRPENVTTVYNGIEPRAATLDTARLRTEFRRSHGFRSDQTVVLFSARNYALKGLEPLLEAFAAVARLRPRAMLAACGSRRDGVFRRQARRLGIAEQVRFLGFVDDVQAAMAGGDVFAFPTFYDPCSLVVPEAMSFSLPVITTAVNGAAELIRPGVDGFVIDEAWNIGAWSEQLGALCDDEALRRRVGAAAAKSAEASAMRHRLHELLAVIRRVAEMKNNHASSPRRAA